MFLQNTVLKIRILSLLGTLSQLVSKLKKSINFFTKYKSVKSPDNLICVILIKSGSLEKSAFKSQFQLYKELPIISG